MATWLMLGLLVLVVALALWPAIVDIWKMEGKVP